MDYEYLRKENNNLFNQEKILVGKKNNPGMAFNPVTLQYDNSIQGEILKNRDDESKCRALLRSIFIDKHCNQGYNLINGEERNIIEKRMLNELKPYIYDKNVPLINEIKKVGMKRNVNFFTKAPHPQFSPDIKYNNNVNNGNNEYNENINNNRNRQNSFPNTKFNGQENNGIKTSIPFEQNNYNNYNNNFDGDRRFLTLENERVNNRRIINRSNRFNNIQRRKSRNNENNYSCGEIYQRDLNNNQYNICGRSMDKGRFFGQNYNINQNEVPFVRQNGEIMH